MSDVKTTDSGADFRVWVEKIGPDLWGLLAQDNELEGAVLEDFFEIAERVRSTKAAAGRHGDLLRTQVFVREWLRRSKNRSDRATLEDRLYLTAYLRLGWPLDDLVFIIGNISPHMFRHRLFEALKRESGLSLAGQRFLGRECARQDLFLVDEVLGLSWRDPLNFLSAEKFRDHRSHCERCRQLFESVGLAVRSVRSRPASLPPTDFLEELGRLGLFSQDWKPNLWIRGWPWYLRVPLQLSAAALVVFGVLAVPYYGDLFPEWRRSLHSHPESMKPSPVAVVAQASPTVAAAPAIPLVYAPTPEPTVMPSAIAATPVVVAATIPAPKAVVKADAKGEVSWNERKFYQWGAFTSKLDADVQTLLALLTRYSAERSGELELGAPNRGGRYFHFSIPTSDYAKFREEVAALGLLEFTEETASSWRRTPVDRRRIVFLLKPKNSP